MLPCRSHNWEKVANAVCCTHDFVGKSRDVLANLMSMFSSETAISFGATQSEPLPSFTVSGLPSGLCCSSLLLFSSAVFPMISLHLFKVAIIQIGVRVDDSMTIVLRSRTRNETLAKHNSFLMSLTCRDK